ncbi:hypothetical protein ONZ45_g18777 [Pleurotus djamor]|nr:hypothetical protein ONZ45_g18777 [Pleurotus djamor]
MKASSITFADLSAWREEQTTYFATLGQEQPENVLAIEYVELLLQLRDLGNKLQAASSSFISVSFASYTSSQSGSLAYGKDLSATRKAETERRYSREQYQTTLRDVIEMEVKMGIERRWEPMDKEFQETLKYMRTRRYHRALENLQKLVIQRLFELQKMNLAGTGYKLRTHIAKSLQTRCKAIQRAITAYNTAALELDPPRPPLNWSEVSHYAFLEDFDLMRETREDIRTKPWAQPLFREMIRRHNRLERAEEEIQRCNIECKRLYTSIVDEEKLFSQVELNLQASNSPIYGALQEFTLRRRRINDHLLTRIYQIYQLPGFTGDRSVGTHVDTPEPSPNESDMGHEGYKVSPEDARSVELDDLEAEAELDTADEANAEVDRLMDFISDLATS